MAFVLLRFAYVGSVFLPWLTALGRTRSHMCKWAAHVCLREQFVSLEARKEFERANGFVLFPMAALTCQTAVCEPATARAHLEAIVCRAKLHTILALAQNPLSTPAARHRIGKRVWCLG